MKSFVDFINEDVEKRARKEMPQIKQHDEFIKDLDDNDIAVFEDSVPASMLEPTQTEFNMEKVESMIAKDEYNTHAIIVTNDHYILDGHHRWKCNEKLGRLQPVKRVNLTFDELFEFVSNKPYVLYHDINESANSMSVLNYMTDDQLIPLAEFLEGLNEDDGGAAPAGGEGSSGSNGNPNGVAGVDTTPTGVGAPMRRDNKKKEEEQ